MDLSDSPGRPACPSRASGWSSLTTPWGLPCCVRFPCVHAVATTPAQRLGLLLRSFTQPCQPSPKGLSGRPAHCPFRGLLGVHSRYGLHTRAVTVNRDTLSEGFSHFVTSMTAPVASGWSDRRVGLTPTGKRRLSTAHTLLGLRGCIAAASGSVVCDGTAVGSERFGEPAMPHPIVQSTDQRGAGMTTSKIAPVSQHPLARCRNCRR
jgi:hypothetical protein